MLAGRISILQSSSAKMERKQKEGKTKNIARNLRQWNRRGGVNQMYLGCPRCCNSKMLAKIMNQKGLIQALKALVFPFLFFIRKKVKVDDSLSTSSSRAAWFKLYALASYVTPI